MTNDQNVTVAVKRLAHGADLPLPSYASAQAAGMDLMAALGPDGKITLEPAARALVPTGLAVALPTGFEAQVRPRSGLAAKQGVTVLNAPGTVDADYRGEVKVILINLGSEPVEITHGQRIAQLVLAPVSKGLWEVSLELPDTVRGTGGFGSTGEA